MSFFEYFSEKVIHPSESYEVMLKGEGIGKTTLLVFILALRTYKRAKQVFLLLKFCVILEIRVDSKTCLVISWNKRFVSSETELFTLMKLGR